VIFRYYVLFMFHMQMENIVSDYHWTFEQMRIFVQTVAETGNVTKACSAVGKSRQSAYALSRRKEGICFRFGWAAARLIARDVISDILIDRALEGSRVETIKDAQGGVTTRHSYDKNLGLAVLARLDKQLDDAYDMEMCMAQIIASDFETYLRLLEAGAGAAEIEHFLKASEFHSQEIHCQLGQKTAKYNQWGDEILPEPKRRRKMEYKSMPLARKEWGRCQPSLA
jgi:hypothetical protein